jgi:hypothetical protein
MLHCSESCSESCVCPQLQAVLASHANMHRAPACVGAKQAADDSAQQAMWARVRGEEQQQGAQRSTGGKSPWAAGERALAAQPWSQEAMVAVVICAMPIAIASPLVVIITTWARMHTNSPPFRSAATYDLGTHACQASLLQRSAADQDFPQEATHAGATTAGSMLNARPPFRKLPKGTASRGCPSTVQCTITTVASCLVWLLLGRPWCKLLGFSLQQ